MKKFLTFTNFLALCGFITLMLFFTPCFTYTPHTFDLNPRYFNLFKAIFGQTIPCFDPTGPSIQTHACAGLILAFVFVILGMILSVVKNRIKLVGFLASASYLTSGILIACAVPMILNCNYDTIGVTATSYKIGYYGWSIAIATLLCVIGVAAFFDTIVSTAKPKVQEVY